MGIRPRIGALLLASGWMRDVGLEGAALAGRIERAARIVREGLAGVGEVVSPPVVTSAAQSAQAGAEIAAADCDCVAVVPLAWCEDQVVRPALARLAEAPLLLCTLVPAADFGRSVAFVDMLAGSGVVATLQASGMLCREDRAFVPVTGRIDDPSTFEAIGAAARAAAAARRLRDARIGVLPCRCEEISVSWVDELGLRARHGIELAPVETGRLAAAATSVSDAEVAERRAALDALGVIVRVDSESLEQAIRAGIGLGRIAAEEGLSGIAMNDLDPGLHRALGLRPCVPDPLIPEPGIAVAMEADVAACAAMIALRVLAGRPAFYGEVLGVDLGADQMLVGHAGWHDLGARDPALPVEIVPDEEYRRTDRLPGAAVHFKAAAGAATLVNAVWRDGRLALSTLEGTSVAGPPVLEGNCHLVFQAGEPAAGLVDRLAARGVSQHWVATPGHRAAEVAALARWMGAVHAG